MNNTIIIEVTGNTQPSAECIPIGASGEHNAAVLKFVLNEDFTSEYKYYLEFTLPNAKSFRTAYLELNQEDNSIIFPVPASLSNAGCVDCCFNAARIDADGITSQLLRPKSLTLLFSPLYNANGEILKEYDFSINTLLENIKNGAFKGDKGDKGSEYILTEDDKTEITDKLTERVFGRLITKAVSAEGSLSLSDASENNAVSFIIQGRTQITKPVISQPVSKDNIARIEGIDSVSVTVNQNTITSSFPTSANSVDNYCDEVDLVSGKFIKRIEVYEFDGSEPIVQGSIFEYNGKPFYRCYFSPKQKMITGSGLPGVCSHFEKVDTYISSQNKLDALAATGKVFNGIWFGQVNGIVYFFTEKSADELSAFFAEQKNNGTPVKINYLLNTPIEEECTKNGFPLTGESNIAVSPEHCTFNLKYYADISKVIENIESKLSQ